MSVKCSSISGWQGVTISISSFQRTEVLGSWALPFRAIAGPCQTTRRDVFAQYLWSSYIKTDFWVFEIYPDSLLSVALVGLYKKSSVRFGGSVSSKWTEWKFYLRSILYIQMKQPYIVIRRQLPTSTTEVRYLIRESGQRQKCPRNEQLLGLPGLKKFLIILLRACKTLGDGAILSIWRYTIQGQLLEKKKKWGLRRVEDRFHWKGPFTGGFMVVQDSAFTTKEFLSAPILKHTPFIFHTPQTSSDPILSFYLHLASSYILISALFL